MKTYKNLYQQIYDFENLHRAYLQARRCKRYKGDVLRFSANLEDNLINIQNHLIWKTYQVGRYNYFKVYEPKERLIAAPSFIDRVVHHALCNIIEPIFEKSMIYDSYACRVGKGTLSGVLRTTRFLRDATRQWDRVYCLKADIRKFFPSIQHDSLKKILRRRISCPDTLWLIDAIIDSGGSNVGLPIGSLTSQLFANICLNELDHQVKDVYRVRYYVRYMDDFVIFHNDKTYLRDLLAEISDYLFSPLCLTMNAKTQIFPVGPRCVDFLGYRIWPEYRLLRKGNVRRVKRKFKKYQCLYSTNEIDLDVVDSAVKSWLGHAKHADTYRLRSKTMSSLLLSRQEDMCRRIE